MEKEGNARNLIIIFLIVIISIALFFIVRGMIKENQASLGKNTPSLEILQVQKINNSAVSVKVKKNGEEQVDGIVLTAYDKNNSEIAQYNLSMSELEEKNFEVNLSINNVSNAEKLTIAPISTSIFGKQTIKDVEDQYIFSENFSKIIIVECVIYSQCNDNNPCTTNTCSNGFCLYPKIISCISNDGCCPSGCTSSNDNDCKSSGGGGGGGSSGGGGNICTDTCVSLGYICGTQTICGSSVTCGNCSTGQICVGGACKECTVNSQCDDSNVCTTDTCSNGICSHSTISGCCTSSSQCSDSNICTTDLCSSNVCSHSIINNCCTSSSQCDDSNACTTDLCSSNVCSNTPFACISNDGCCPAGCNIGNDNDCKTCTSNSQCDDGNVCTLNVCSGNVCTYPTISGCCTSSSQCSDSNVCTTDLCSSNTCSHSIISNCCTSSLDCGDNNACTTDSCSNNVCVHTAVTCNDNNACTTDTCSTSLGCQYTPLNCDDSNACTTDTCSGGICLHTQMNCSDGNICTTDTCNSGTCSYSSISGCCTSSSQCGSNQVCTNNVCVLNCTAETNTVFCSRLGKNCGSVTANDNCGNSRTVSSCGNCSTGYNCQTNGTCMIIQTGIWSDELVINGGFEWGNLTGWTISGSYWHASTSGWAGNATPANGSYLAYTGSNNVDWVNGYIYQDVDLSGYATQIDTGTAGINASGWGISSELPPQDWTRVQIMYLFSNKTIIKTAADSGYLGIWPWKRYGVFNDVPPVGTRYVRVWGNTYESGSNSAAGLDSFSVKIKTSGTCTPTTCVALGKNCGSWSDGCGGILTCGSYSGGCQSGYTCQTNGTCINSQTATCSDGIQNQGETGIDCGGPCSACISSLRTFYVNATTGNDNNNGLSPSSPWKTLSKVSNTQFQPGDAILFRRGDTFRGDLVISSSGSSGKVITYGAYGIGNKPKLLGSKDISSTSDWTSVGSNIWKTSATLGTTLEDCANLIFNNEASYGVKKTSLGELASQGDFFYNTADSLVYIYSTSNPGSYYTHIEAGGVYGEEQVITIDGPSYVTVQNLDVRYSANNGIITFSGANHIIIEYCDVSWIGGMYVTNDHPYRMGNCIGVWEDGSDITIRYNSVNQCYDAGISPQGGR